MKWHYNVREKCTITSVVEWIARQDRAKITTARSNVQKENKVKGLVLMRMSCNSVGKG